jgi:hypothetical protein
MPVDKAIVEAQIRALPGLQYNSFGTKREVAYLPELLAEGETIKALSSGTVDAKMWLIVVTDRRILLLDKGIFFGLSQLELPIAGIRSVSHKTGMLLGEILIDTGGRSKRSRT